MIPKMMSGYTQTQKLLLTSIFLVDNFYDAILLELIANTLKMSKKCS